MAHLHAVTSLTTDDSLDSPADEVRVTDLQMKLVSSRQCRIQSSREPTSGSFRMSCCSRAPSSTRSKAHSRPGPQRARTSSLSEGKTNIVKTSLGYVIRLHLSVGSKPVGVDDRINININIVPPMQAILFAMRRQFVLFERTYLRPMMQISWK